MAKHGKKYQELKKLVDTEKMYTIEEAIDLLLKTSNTKFDASCEMHLNLDIDPKQADQMVRNTVSLPHGTGKNVRIIAFVEEDQVKPALTAGAIKAGLDELVVEVEKGFSEFDIAVATPDVMKSIAKLAKTLGPKGLMPNPKSGTVTKDVVQAIGELKKGRIEFKNDKQSIIHSIFGKVSFGKEKLLENAVALRQAILDSKPSGVKGTYITSIYLTTTMGPSVQISV